jgi:hypothetical protein
MGRRRMVDAAADTAAMVGGRFSLMRAEGEGGTREMGERSEEACR